MKNRHPSRRDAIKAGILAGAGLAIGRLPLAAEAGKPVQLPLITKPIPSTGEQIPVVGLGSNQYGVSTPEEMAPLREVLRQMPVLEGKVIDTAPSYRGSHGGHAEGAPGFHPGQQFHRSPGSRPECLASRTGSWHGRFAQRSLRRAQRECFRPIVG